MDPAPGKLQGRHVALEPLELRHAQDLFRAAGDDDVWRYMPVPRPSSVTDVERWIHEAVQLRERRQAFAFATIDRSSSRAAGSTRFMDIRNEHRGVEIGWTWLGREHWRTPLNTEAKLLLLSFAFEQWGMHRVQLKTDARNERSQRAIERLGAVREGTLRRHIVCPDGHVRDTVMYSIVAAEWPSVKERLERSLAPRVG
jgi:RimJ/RimL family protein N-acetyltransferase